MKKIFLLLVAIGGAFITLTGETNSNNGKAGYTNSPGEGNCTTSGCHSSFAVNTGGGMVMLSNSNMMSWSYDPGVTYHMTCAVTRSANSLFGVCVEALDTSGNNGGTLVITNSSKTQIKTRTINTVVRRSVTHQLNGGASSGSMSFTFDWIAPATNIGTVTFYFAGVAANANGNSTGDYVYTGSQAIAYNTLNGITSPTYTNSFSVYPMPIQDQFTVNYNVASTGILKIKLYTMQGAVAAELANKILVSGDYKDNFYLPDNLSSGNYLLSVESSSGLNTRKILINK